MKSYAVSIRFENWIGEEMIQIHQHGQQQYQRDLLPVFSEKYKCHHKWKPKMQKVMNKGFPRDKIHYTRPFK